jgi:hypothetical protein
MNVSYIRVITIACTVYILHNQWFSGSQVSKIPESWKLSKTPENWQNLGISNVKLLMYAVNRLPARTHQQTTASLHSTTQTL